ncbi:MAG: HEAT repeat domain-containing protein [Gemmatimonadales bacterium]|nr:HEAT repeat domain-containing protein [Gemmatimonadales bacterium]
MHSPLSIYSAALLLTTAPLSLGAQSNAERVLSGRHTPSHDYDLIHQRVEVRNFDWDSTAFDGRVTTTVVSLRPGLDSVILDMGRQLEVRSIVSTNGRRLQYSRPGDSLVVRLAAPVPFRDTVRFTVDYRGRITHGRGLYFFQEEPGRPQQVYSGGGTDGNPRWIPTYGPPHDKATWEVIATVPERFTVVSNGRLVSDRRGAGGVRTTHWRQDRPASTYLLSLVAAPLVKVSDLWREVSVDYYVYPRDSLLARPLFGATPEMMETFSRLTGVRYPWAKYAQTTAAEFIGGMENVSATTLVDWLPDARAYRDRPWYQHTLIPHELAHQWFGNLVTAQNWANYWLNEGFAQFMVGQYWGAKLGRQAEDDFYLDEYRQFVATDARKRMPLATYNSNNVYFKGALVLEMLKKQLGPERFWGAVNRYLTRHRYANATTDDLRQAVLQATGENLEWFWSQWIYRAGYPEFAVTAAYDSAAAEVTLTVRQTQPDTATADSAGFRFATPLVFRSPIAIRVGTPAGDVVARVVIDRREQTVRIGGVRAAPTMVVFDDSNAVLKTLAFEQPTAWIATQLARHHDLWNRSWAIGQLARRPGDVLAAAALGRAARGADYYLTRAEAAGALGGFPRERALPALQAAMGDTSAQVREAAVTALGAVGGGRAAELARRAWTTDPSYEVRAAALTALARVQPERSRKAVLAALSTPSYRDAIQNAAIAAVVQRPDSGLVAALERVAGQQPLPAIALGVLAARGDRYARAALERRMRDQRPWVRRWAREASERDGSGS